MVFKRKVVTEDVPAVTPVVTPVQQPVVERHVTVDRDGMGGGTAVALILAGIFVIALVWYLAWYRPQTEVVTTPSAPSVIERNNTEIRTQPMAVPSPSTSTTIVNPPAPTPSTTVVTPPANNTTVVTPPPADTDTTTSTTTDETGASTTTTTTTDNNGG